MYDQFDINWNPMWNFAKSLLGKDLQHKSNVSATQPKRPQSRFRI